MLWKGQYITYKNDTWEVGVYQSRRVYIEYKPDANTQYLEKKRNKVEYPKGMTVPDYAKKWVDATFRMLTKMQEEE